MIKIALLDDEVLITNLHHNDFNKESDFNVVLASNNSTDFFNFIKNKSNTIDIAIIDLKLNEESGVDVAVKLKSICPEIRIIILSSNYKLSFFGFMLKKGIDAFLPKELIPPEIKEIIRHVVRHGHYHSPEQVNILKTQIKNIIPQPSISLDPLSEREKEVLLCICKQLSAKETADKLFLSPKTIEGHKSRLIQKTGAKNSAGLVFYALKHNLFDSIELGNF